MEDDNKYIALMDKYKRARMKDGKEAMKYLEAAMALREMGKVSEDAVIGGAYL